MFNTISDIQEFINVSNDIDIELLLPYKGAAMERLCRFIPEKLFPEIKEKEEKAYKEIKRATANYMVVYAIPFLKIKLSNIGGVNYDDVKMKNASWWDLRDFGLSAVKIADKALNSAIEILEKTEFGSKLTLPNGLGLFQRPKDVNEFYSIGDSWDVLLQLQSTIKTVFQLYVQEKLCDCTLADILGDVTAKMYLKAVIGNYAISNAVLDSSLTFTQSGLVVQWEELPWQKTQVLSSEEKSKLSDLYKSRGDDYMDLLMKYLRNSDSFSCFLETEKPVRKTIVKKSGLYL